MPNSTIRSKIISRNDLAQNWTAINPVLLKGEMGIETDTGHFKFGDGITTWNALTYVVGDPSTMLTCQFATNEKTAQGYVDHAIEADGLTGTIPASQVTGLGAAAKLGAGTQAGQVPILNADGKLDAAVLPPLAINVVFLADNEAEMLAVNAQSGDMVIRVDEGRTYVLWEEPAHLLPNWIALRTPNYAKTGFAALTSSDVPECDHLYNTEERASADLTSDGFILDGGNA